MSPPLMKTVSAVPFRVTAPDDEYRAPPLPTDAVLPESVPPVTDRAPVFVQIAPPSPFVAVLLPNVLPFASFDRKYVGLAKYPAVSRDISMVVPKEIMVGQIEAMITQRGGKILESLSLFDIYEGSQIKDGYKSVAYNITFRAKDRTLNEDDINGAMKKILNGLESLGIELRA